MIIQKIREVLTENSLDGFLVSNFYNIFYLTSFKGLAPEEREAWVLILKDGVYFFTDQRYQDKAKFQDQNLKIIIYEPGKNIIYYLKEIINKKNLQRIGFEGEDLRFLEYWSLKQNLSVKLIPFFNLIKKERALKNEKEIDLIKKACEIGDWCLSEVEKYLKPGVSEKEIAFKIEFILKEKGYDLAFYPIVAFGKNSSIIHYDTREGDGVIENTDVILIDFGVKYQGYCSDVTRMFFINPSSQMINTYEKLLKIQNQAIDYIFKSKPKVYKQIDLYCRELFKKEGFPDIPHSLGHGVGLEIHEFPKVSFLSEEKLTAYNVFTIEPGVYFQGQWGMRIEDTVYLDENFKPQLLTKFDKRIKILK
ncbi:MAG: M24 family metallopeptidase [Microgenomates group bacterium]